MKTTMYALPVDPAQAEHIIEHFSCGEGESPAYMKSADPFSHKAREIHYIIYKTTVYDAVTKEVKYINVPALLPAAFRGFPGVKSWYVDKSTVDFLSEQF